MSHEATIDRAPTDGRSTSTRSIATSIADLDRRSETRSPIRRTGGRGESRSSPVPSGRVRACPRETKFATGIVRVLGGYPRSEYKRPRRVVTAGSPAVLGGRGRITDRTAAVRGGRRSFGHSATARFRTTVRPPGGRIGVGGGTRADRAPGSTVRGRGRAGGRVGPRTRSRASRVLGPPSGLNQGV